MLTHIHLKNFKAFAGEHVVPLAPITFTVGANSSGKSTLLQALLVLRQSWSDNDQLPLDLRTEGTLVKLGRPSNVVHGQRPAMMELGFGFPGGEVVFQYDFEQSARAAGEDGSYIADVQALTGMRLGRPRNVGAYAAGAIRVSDSPLVFEVMDARRAGRRVVLPERDGMALTGAEKQGDVPPRYRDYVLTGDRWEFHGRQRCDRTVADARALHLDNARRALNAVQYVGPLRVVAQRHYGLRVRGRRVGVDGGLFVAFLYAFPAVRYQVNEWLAELKLPYCVETHDFAGTAPLGELQLTETDANVVVGLPDVGFGLSQLLPILTQLALALPTSGAGAADAFGQVVLIEQPELHLHPALQTRFGWLLADVMTRLRDAERGPEGLEDERHIGGRLRTQIICETHSEHIINAVRSRVARGDLSPEDVGLLAVHRQHRRPRLAQIPLNSHGEFGIRWPEGFFVQPEQEV